MFDGARIGLPLNGAPSSHILKPAIPGVEDSVVNERFCMALADTMHLTHVDTELVQADAWFPAFDAGQWRETACEPHPADDRHPLAFRFSDYRRVSP